MKALEQKYQEWTSDFHHGELLFFAGYILILFRGMWLSTMFPQNRILSLLCIPVAALLVGLKILLFDRYPLKQFFALLVVLVCTMLSCYFSRTVNAFLMILLVLGSKDIEFEKILKVYLVIVGAVLVLAFLASLVGVIENLQYEQSGRRLRNAFGIIYPTDFAAHVFYFLTVLFYVKRDTLRPIHYILTIGLAGLLYYYCDTRLDSISILLLVVIFWIGNVMEHSLWVSRNVKHTWISFWQKIGVYSVPIAAAISNGATFLYRESSSFWKGLNKLLSNRLHLGQNAYDEYGIRLFGQDIEMVGFGGTVKTVQNYNFVDCSYVHVLLVNGILFFTILMVLYVWCCRARKHDIYFLCCIGVIAINCMIAHHILQVEYTVWLLAVLAMDWRGGYIRSSFRV